MLVADKRGDTANVIPPPIYRFDLPRPVMIGVTVLFWALFLMGVRFLAS
jgi:hypothetical protein